jgi:hypothetical protein
MSILNNVFISKLKFISYVKTHTNSDNIHTFLTNNNLPITDTNTQYLTKILNNIKNNKYVNYDLSKCLTIRNNQIHCSDFNRVIFIFRKYLKYSMNVIWKTVILNFISIYVTIKPFVVESDFWNALYSEIINYNKYYKSVCFPYSKIRI